MDKPTKNNVYNFVGAFSGISVNDCIGGSSIEVHDVRIQSDNWCLCSVSEEVKVTNCYSERVCVIKQENPGNDSEQDPLFINEDDLSRKIILERNDSTSPFFSKIKKEKPDNDLNQDPLLLTEQDYINFANNGGKVRKIKVEDVNKTTLHLKDLRVVLERIDTNVFLPSPIVKENTDVLAASSVNGNEKERSLAKVTSFPSTKEQSGDVVNILEKRVKESAHNVDSTILFSKDVINPEFSKNECQGKSLEQSIICGNCQRTKLYSHVPYTLVAQNNKVNKNCECRSNDKVSKKMEVTSHTKKKELVKCKSLMHFLCSYCGNTFSSKMRLNKHTMTHTRKKPFHCSYYEYTSSHKGHLKDILTHTHEKPFKCAYCEYRCITKGALKRHIMTHTGTKPHTCAYCEYKCSEIGNLKRHILTHMGVKPFKCSYCEFRCITKERLKRHILTHTAVKPFKCSYCEYRCSLKGYLNRHISTHTGVKPFKCSYCEYRCSQKGNLKRHILTHTAVKLFKCSYCEYRCSQKVHLNRHILTHTGAKPFNCSYCEYRCSQKVHLNRHILTHTGAKPFKCAYCEYRCSQKGTLKRHILTHTGVKQFQCSYCEYTCIQKHSLSKHVKKHAGVKVL